MRQRGRAWRGPQRSMLVTRYCFCEPARWNQRAELERYRLVRRRLGDRLKPVVDAWHCGAATIKTSMNVAIAARS